MRNRIARLVAVVIAAVLSLLAAPGTEAIALAPAESPSTYVYDSQHHPVLVPGVVSERGPPATHHQAATSFVGLLKVRLTLRVWWFRPLSSASRWSQTRPVSSFRGRAAGVGGGRSGLLHG